MRCIRQYFRKRALIREHTITNQQLLNDIDFVRYMKENKWEDNSQSNVLNTIIFRRQWQRRFIKRLKAL